MGNEPWILKHQCDRTSILQADGIEDVSLKISEMPIISIHAILQHRRACQLP